MRDFIVDDVSEEEFTTLTSEDFGVDLSFTARESVKEYVEYFISVFVDE